MNEDMFVDTIRRNIPLIFTAEDKLIFNRQYRCKTCHRKFDDPDNPDSVKCRHHNHYSGK